MLSYLLSAFLIWIFCHFFLTTLGFITVKDSDRFERASESSTATKEFKTDKDRVKHQKHVYPSWNGSQVLAGSYSHQMLPRGVQQRERITGNTQRRVYRQIWPNTERCDGRRWWRAMGRCCHQSALRRNGSARWELLTSSDESPIR